MTRRTVNISRLGDRRGAEPRVAGLLGAAGFDDLAQPPGSGADHPQDDRPRPRLTSTYQ